MIHIPILRAGKPYKSLETYSLPNLQTGESVCEVSMANRGLIAKDIRSYTEHKKKFNDISITESLNMCKSAADYFANADLPINGDTQTRDDYINSLSITTGLPQTLCKKNMTKIQGVLEKMVTVLNGMTRNNSLSFFDRAEQDMDTGNINFICMADSLGAVLPNNSPGVHTLWLPAIPMKVPLCIRPGSNEPWTAYRIIQALIQAGFPREVFGFYPSDYSGSLEIVLRTDRSMVFGDRASVEQWRHDPRVQIHGPGWSKIIFGSDMVKDWEKYLDFIETSVAVNSGRSCINVSSIWVPSHGREIASALAERLLKMQPLSLDHPNAKLAAFSDRRVAKSISSLIVNHLHHPGAVDITNTLAEEERVAELDGWTFLRPTVIFTENPSHPLANTEFLFPFVSVVELPEQDIIDHIGNTLVASVVSDNQAFLHDFINYKQIDRLNIGPIPSTQILYDQPHEGNLFDHLYRQRALQRLS